MDDFETVLFYIFVTKTSNAKIVGYILSQQTKIAFYAPLKPPDHPIPSGDRQMARMLFAALEHAGYEVDLASKYISYSKRHGKEHMDARIAGAHEEAQRIIDQWQESGTKPDLWFCYHPYDKSPDWLGMEICERLNIPMITAEPCKTGQGPNDEWVPWRKEAQRGIKMAAMNIVMTHSDKTYLSTFIDDEKVVWMPPFIDRELLFEADGFDAPALWPDGNSVKLLSVGMMRPGAKLDSYKVLSESLKQIEHLNWSLVIAGGGPGMDEVRELFSWAGKRVIFAGEKSPEEVISLMSWADILTWPGCREAYGMVYLEVACFGVPAIALDNMGVPLVVEHQRTGLLADMDEENGYASALEQLIIDPKLRKSLGEGAKEFALNERSAISAAEQLKTIIDDLLKE